jgi:hypothetical protein
MLILIIAWKFPDTLRFIYSLSTAINLSKLTRMQFVCRGHYSNKEVAEI